MIAEESPARSPFSLSLVASDPILVLALQGDLDLKNVPLCCQQVESALATLGQDTPIDCILDLSQCPYVDSTGLDVFIRLMKTARQSGGQAVFACPCASVQQVFQITLLTQMLVITDTMEAAMAVFTRKAAYEKVP
jgi:anti-sigma B factor antagonist